MEKREIGHIEAPLKRIHIELTNACEFDCVFCPKPMMERAYGFMKPELGKKIISEIAETGLSEKVTFHVMGEPTLHPQLFTLLEHAAREKVKVGLTTNGKNLGGEVGKKLLDYPLGQLDISFQTPDEESFVLREAGKLVFEDYLNGILDFFTEYRKRWPETTIKFRFLNTRFQKKSMEKMTGSIQVMSTSKEMRKVFAKWILELYERVGKSKESADAAIGKLGKVLSYKWNVVEILPNLYFETYILDDWGMAFHEGKVYDAWGGYCFGMRDHFAILQNGDVTLCCIDFKGKTTIGNVTESTLVEILSSDKLGAIMDSFKRYKPLLPYCKRCMGSKSRLSWLVKPLISIFALDKFKPFFYNEISLCDEE